MVEIPPDTKWYEVRGVTDDELSQLRNVNYADFNGIAAQNELLQIAPNKHIVEQRRNQVIEEKSPPANWEPPILWGHTKEGPFTIIEGNKRLIAYAASGRAELNISVLVGLSPMRCHWHLSDQASFLMYDLISQRQ
jgi:hypothetical protein